MIYVINPGFRNKAIYTGKYYTGIYWKGRGLFNITLWVYFIFLFLIVIVQRFTSKREHNFWFNFKQRVGVIWLCDVVKYKIYSYPFKINRNIKTLQNDKQRVGKFYPKIMRLLTFQLILVHAHEACVRMSTK